MFSQSNLKRRLLIKSSLALLVASVYGCSTQPQKPTSIDVNVTGVDTIPKLIEAIKRAGGRWLPDSLPNTYFIKEFARTFVKNARAAAENGFKIPQWVLDKIPVRKVVIPILGVMIFTAYGIQFVIPVATVVVATLGSLAIMSAAILAAIAELMNPNSTI